MHTHRHTHTHTHMRACVCVCVCVCVCAHEPFRAKLFWLSVMSSQLCPPVRPCVCLTCDPALLGSASVSGRVWGGVPASLPTTICFSSIRKRIPLQPCSHQRAAHKPPSTIFSFSPEHAHGYHLCADLKWTLRTLLLRGPNRNDLYP